MGTDSVQLRRMLCHSELLRLDYSIFVQHAILTATFLVVPHFLVSSLHISAHGQVWFYLVVLLLAFLAMIPGVIIAEKKRRLRTMMRCSVLVLLLSVALMMWQGERSLWFLGISLWLFFTAFSLLEAILPSLVTKLAPLRARGTAMGIYSSSQFMGIFVGGAVGGLLQTHFAAMGVLWFVFGLLALWFLVLLFMQKVPYFSTAIFSDKALQESSRSTQLASLAQQPGVAEVAWAAAEGLIYLKVDKKKVNMTQLRKRFEQGTL